MSEWRYTAYDLRTGNKLADLEVQSWKSVDDLVGPGSFTAELVLDGAAASTGTAFGALPILDDDTGLPITDDDSDETPLLDDPMSFDYDTARRTVVADATRCGRSLIVAERDGVPIYSGIVWRRRYDANRRLLTISGAGLLSYFDHWVPGRDFTYTAQDQFAIIRSFVTRIAAAAGGDIGLQVTPEDSGVARDRTYPRFDGLTFGELMANLAKLVNGFDMTARVEYNAGNVERWVRLWYPRRGRDITQTGLRFRAPGNATLYDMDEDATNMAVTVYAIGAGDGQDMLIRPGSQTALIDAGWPGFITTRAYKSVTEGDTLQAHADADALRLSGIDGETFSVQVDPDNAGQPYGAWDLGDDCYLIVADDALYPARDDHSPGLVKIRRVTQHRWEQKGQSESLVIGLDRKVIP